MTICHAPIAQPPGEMAHLQRFYAGLAKTGLSEDLAKGEHTLLAPLDAAFDRAPWSFDSLLSSPQLLEERYDLFEYLVIRGIHGAASPRIQVATLEGRSVLLGEGRVFGHGGSARIIESFIWRSSLVHVISECIYPWGTLVLGRD
jgi:hypothetical protein